VSPRIHSHPRCGIHSASGGRQNARLRSPLLLHDTKWPTTERRPGSTPRRPNPVSLSGPSPILAWGNVGALRGD
jgi:hypothetical protein